MMHSIADCLVVCKKTLCMPLKGVLEFQELVATVNHNRDAVV